MYARLFAFAFVLAALAAGSARAQFYDQDEIGALLYQHRDSLDFIPQVTFRYHVVRHPMNNSVLGRMELYREVGRGDVNEGRRMLTGAVEFFNGFRIGDLAIGDTIILPSHYDLDFRAYAPFPRSYPGAEGFDKLLILHKGVQSWAAYANGRLVRWGLINTGASGSPTPGGRYNVNWQTPFRVSSLSPPGERWEMRWVSNIDHAEGIHLHQYSMPIGAPASHGCVRLIMADAQWIYNWVDPWVTTAGRGQMGGRILRQGTTVLVLGEGEEPAGPPRRFVHTDAGPALRIVELPDDPYSVPPGTEQQRFFDRQRQQRAQRGR